MRGECQAEVRLFGGFAGTVAIGALALLLVFAAFGAHYAKAAAITNHGASEITFDSGFLKVSSAPDLDIASLPASPKISGDLAPDGSFTAPVSGFSFGQLKMTINAGLAGNVTYGLDVSATAPITGSVDPVAGEVSLELSLKVKMTLLAGSSYAAVGDQCYIGSDQTPIRLSMSTETGPSASTPPGLSLGGRPLDPDQGDARIADTTFAVPGQTGCSGAAGGQVNSQLGPPSSIGASVTEFELSISPPPISPPGIAIVDKPTNPSSDLDPSFRIRSNLPAGYDLECRLDQSGWTPCGTDTQINFFGLSLGGHSFDVRSSAPGGIEGPSAGYDWLIEEQVNEPPVADLKINPQPVGLNQTAILSAAGSVVEAGVKMCTNPVPAEPDCGYRWDFDGDGTVDRVTNGSATSRQFSAPGLRTSRVTVFDTEGRSSSSQDLVEVESVASLESLEPWQLPAADLLEGDGSVEPPAVETGPDGTSVAIWQRSNGEHEVVEVSVRPPGGAFGPVQTLSETDENALWPDVAVGPAGEVTAVWISEDDNFKVLRSRTRRAGESFGPVESLSNPEPGPDDMPPRVAAGSDGTTAVVWTRYDGRLTVHARVRPPGGAFGPAEALSSRERFGFLADASVSPDGQTTVVWQEVNLPIDGITEMLVRTRTRSAAGSWNQVETLSEAGQFSTFPRVAAGPRGNVTVVWLSERENGFVVQSSTREPGTPPAPIETLSAPGNDLHEPQVDTGVDGTTAVAWSLNNGSHKIVQAKIRPPGAPFGPTSKLSGAGRDAEDPVVRVSPQGSATVVWKRFDGSDDVIQARTLLNSGEMTATENLSDSGASASSPGNRRQRFGPGYGGLVQG